MNNYPDGVTGAMIEESFGGPEDEVAEILLLNLYKVVIVTLSSAGNLLLQVFNLDGDNEIEIELEFSLGDGRELADAIMERVT